MTGQASLARVLRRHPLAVRTVLVEVALVGAAYLVISTWQSGMANVVFGILVLFALALGTIAALVGATIAATRLRRG